LNPVSYTINFIDITSGGLRYRLRFFSAEQTSRAVIKF